MAKSNESIKTLLSIAGREEWKDWLFHLQNNLIQTGYCEALTKKGRDEFASKMQGLHDFFHNPVIEKN